MSAQTEMMNNASRAYMTAGLSANEYMDTAISFSGALLKSLSGDTEKAAKLTDMAISDMADQANKYGRSVAEVSETYKSLARGNTMTLDNLFGGMFAGTKAGLNEMLRYAEKYRAGLGETVSYSADSYADIVSAIHDVSQAMGVYGTTADEAQRTIQGSLNMTKSAWQNLLTGLGNADADIGQLVDDLVTSVGYFANNVVPIAEQALSSFGTAFSTLAPQLADSVIGLITNVLPGLVSAAVSLIQTLVETIVSNSGQIINAAISIVQTLIHGISSIAPTLITGVLQLVGQLATSLGQALPTLIPEIVGIVVAMAEALTNPDSLMAVINGALELIKGLAEGIVKALPVLIEALPQIIENIVSFLQQALPTLLTVGGQILIQLIRGILSNIPTLWTSVAQIWGTLYQGIVSMLPELFNAGAELLNELVLGLLNALPELIQQAPAVINAFVDTLVGNATALARSGAQLITQLTNGLFVALPKVLEQMPAIVEAIGQAIIEATPQIVEAGGKLISGLWNGIKSAFGAKNGNGHGSSGKFGEGLANQFGFDTLQTQATATTDAVGNAFGNLNFDTSAFNSSIDLMNQNMTGLTSTAVSTSELLASSLGTGAARAEQLENRFAASATTAKDNVVNAFFSMGTEASAAVSSAAQGASADWSGIPKGAQTAAKHTVSAFENLPNQFRAIWQQIKTIYNEVPSFFTRVFTVAKENVLAAWSTVPAQFAAIFTQIENTALISGGHFVQNFATGLRNAISTDLVPALTDMAQTVADYGKFSEPKKGPLSDFHKSGPDMVKLFADGVRKSRKYLVNSISDTFDIWDAIPNPANDYTFSASAISGNLAKQTIPVRNTTDAKIDTLINLLRTYLPQLGNQQIVLDDGTLVGAMLPQIDAELGQSYLYKLRGNA